MTRSNILAGTALACAAGLAFAGNTTAAKLAYDGGANPLTYLAVRSILAGLLVLGIIAVTRRSLDMPIRRRLAALGLGALAALYSYGLLAAIEYIPVALAVLIFYTFPLFTSIFTWLRAGHSPSPGALTALLVAFAGLALALDVGGGQLNFAGVALAFMAALGVTGVMVLNNRLVGSSDPQPVTFHMMISAALIVLIATAVFDEFSFPHSTQGWFTFGLGAVCYALAIVTLFTALSLAGAVPTSLTMNVEPVGSLVLGFLVLGQDLSIWQVAGVALVIAAVLSVRLAGAGVRVSDREPEA